jgi:hypothetical protein
MAADTERAERKIIHAIQHWRNFIMKYLRIILFLQVLFSLSLTMPDLPDAAQQNLLLFYSNDVIGETEPCG